MTYPILDCIDIHAHGFPERYLRAISAKYPEKVRLAERAGESLIAYWTGAPLPAWDKQQRLREMTRDGTGVEILSAPTIYAWLDQETHRFCVELNDFQASMARERPDKFRSFLHLPVHEPDAAIRELGRWRNCSEVAGVVFGSNMGGIYPGDATLLPIWEAIRALDLPVFIHPVTPAACFGPVVAPIILFPCDTTLAAASIIYGASSTNFPESKSSSRTTAELSRSSPRGSTWPSMSPVFRRLTGKTFANFPAGTCATSTSTRRRDSIDRHSSARARSWGFSTSCTARITFSSEARGDLDSMPS